MSQSFFYRFLVRWFVCGLGLWIAAGILSAHISFGTEKSLLAEVIMSGFILAVINVVLRPLAIVISVPAIFLTLGFFMVVVNGFMVWLVSKLYSPLHITNFWGAILAGVIIGLVNYLVTAILEKRET